MNSSSMKEWLKNHYTHFACFIIGILAILFILPSIIQISGHTNQTDRAPFDLLQEFDLLYKEPEYKSANYLLSDQILAIIPNYEFTIRSLKEFHQFPLWNPHILAGTPFFADSQVAMFEWSRLIGYLAGLSSEPFLLFTKFFTLLVAGYGCFFLFRSWSMSRIASLSGALLFSYSGPILVWLGYPIATTVAWVPGIFLCIEKSLTSKPPNNSWWLLGLASATMSLWLAGYPQIACLALIIASLFTLIRKPNTQVEWKKKILVTTFLLLGTGLAAFQLVPSWHMIRESQSYAIGRGSRASTSFIQASREDLHPRESWRKIQKIWTEQGPLFLDPTFYGSPLDRSYKPPQQNPLKNFSEVTWFTGTATLILALLSLILLTRKKPVLLFWLGTAIVSAGVALDIPMVRLIGLLPLLNRISASRFRLLFVFSLIVIATHFIEELLKKRQVKKHTFQLPQQIAVIGLGIYTISQLWSSFQPFSLPISRRISSTNDSISPLIEQIQQDPLSERRVLAIGIPGAGFRSPLIPNSAMREEVLDIRGYNPLLSTNIASEAAKNLTQRGSIVLADEVPRLAYINQLGVLSPRVVPTELT